MTSEDGSESVKQAMYEGAAPIARFVGHSFAVGIGFALLTPALLIPVGVVQLLIYFGFKELGSTLQWLEVGLLYGEIVFFVVTLLIGAVELLLVEIARSWGRVKAAYR